MPLTADRVNTIFAQAIASQEEIDAEKAVLTDVLVGVVGLVPERLEPFREEIGEMLHELPETFHMDKGGGWSFLEACNDRHGNQWTGLHRTMAELFALGVATDQAVCLLPRAMWSALPGGMPYYGVK